jgi:hypothetical protein
VKWKAFCGNSFGFLVAAERPKEAPAGTLEKQRVSKKLAMKSGK